MSKKTSPDDKTPTDTNGVSSAVSDHPLFLKSIQTRTSKDITGIQHEFINRSTLVVTVGIPDFLV